MPKTDPPHAEPSTSEALMTDPTTEEGAAYWQERHDDEARLEELGEQDLGGQEPCRHHHVKPRELGAWDLVYVCEDCGATV